MAFFGRLFGKKEDAPEEWSKVVGEDQARALVEGIAHSQQVALDIAAAAERAKQRPQTPEAKLYRTLSKCVNAYNSCKGVGIVGDVARKQITSIVAALKLARNYTPTSPDDITKWKTMEGVEAMVRAQEILRNEHGIPYLDYLLHMIGANEPFEEIDLPQ